MVFGHLDHIFWVSYLLCFGIGGVVFGGWQGDFQDVVFSNAIKIVWCKNMPGARHELVSMVHLDHMCLVHETWWVGLGRLNFGCWLDDWRKYVIFNIIVWGLNFILIKYMIKNFDNLVKFRVKFIHFIISIIRVSTNRSPHVEEPFIRNWHPEKLKFCVRDVVAMGLC